MGSRSILITGCTGFLGRALAYYLHLQGHYVIGLGRVKSVSMDAVNQYLSADLCNLSETRDALATVRSIDCVFHLAAVTTARHAVAHPALYYSINVGGLANLLIALRLRMFPEVRFVFASTGAVYGKETQSAFVESAEVHPVGPYAITKYMGEQLLHQELTVGSLASAISLRLFNVSGSIGGVVDLSESRLLPKLMRVAAGVDPIFYMKGDGTAVRDFVDVRDFVRACELVLLTERLRHFVMNIGGGPLVSVREAVSIVRFVSGREVPVTFQSDAVGEQGVVRSDCSRAMMSLGWRPRILDAGEMIAGAWRAFNEGAPFDRM